MIDNEGSLIGYLDNWFPGKMFLITDTSLLISADTLINPKQQHCSFLIIDNDGSKIGICLGNWFPGKMFLIKDTYNQLIHL